MLRRRRSIQAGGRNMARSFWVYIITNHTNSVLYIGMTNNINRRIFEHRSGVVKSSFSKKYKLYKLVWAQEFPTALEAITAEKKMKGWTREKKMSLILKNNPEFENLTLR
jgi:putative endonuclease